MLISPKVYLPFSCVTHPCHLFQINFPKILEVRWGGTSHRHVCLIRPHSPLASARSSPRTCDQVYLFFFCSYLSHLIILCLVSILLLWSLLQALWMGLQDFAVYTPMWILNQITAQKKARFPQTLFQSSFRVLLRLSHSRVLSWMLFWTTLVVEGDTQSWSQPCQSMSSVSQFSCSMVSNSLQPHGLQQSKFWVLIEV